MWEQMDVWTRVTVRLRAIGMSKRELAERIGISDTSLSRILRLLTQGDRDMRLGPVVAMAQEMGVSIDWMLTGQGEPETQKTGEAVVASPPSLPRSPVSDAAIADGVAALQRTAPVRKRRA